MNSETTINDLNSKTAFGHPIGLFVLFFTEIWERFSYYGMRALFTLFLVAKTDSDNPGFGWTNSEAICYMVGIPCLFMLHLFLADGLLTYFSQKKQ